MNNFKKVSNATHNFDILPTGILWDYYTKFPKFKEAATKRQNHTSKMICALLESQKLLGNTKIKDGEHLFEIIEKGNNVILDRVNHNIDVLNGVSKSDGEGVIAANASDSNDKSQEANN